MTASIDDRELRAFAAELDEVAQRLVRGAPRVVKRGATNIVNQLRAEMGASRHFKGITRAVNYDILDGGFAAEIGPTSEPGSAGNLANIAYFGSYRGGGTVPDPQDALDAEGPRFEKALLDLMGEAL